MNMIGLRALDDATFIFELAVLKEHYIRNHFQIPRENVSLAKKRQSCFH